MSQVVVVVTTLCPLCINKETPSKSCSVCNGHGMIHKPLDKKEK